MHAPSHCKLRTGIYALLWILLLASICLFIIRGPMRSLQNSTDFFLIYASATAWYHGENPYDASHIRPWINERHGDTRVPQRSLNLLYPPMTYPLLLPWSIQYWPSAKLTWILTNLLCFAGLIYVLVRLFNLHRHRMKLMCFLILAIAFGPVHSTFSVGQVTLVVTFGLALAMWLLKSNRSIAGGCCMGVFIALKPHLVGLFALRPLFQRQGKALAGIVLVPLLLLILGVVPLMYNNIDWFNHWQQNVTQFEQQGEGSTQLDYHLRYQMIHVDVVLHGLMHEIGVLRFIARGLLLGACGLSVWWWMQRPNAARDIASLGVLVTATLLFAYHRYYDATLLLIPLAGMIALANRKQHWSFFLSLGCFLPFIIPSNAMLGWWDKQGYLPGWLTDSHIWDLILIPHFTWFLLIATGSLLAWSWQSKDMDHENASKNHGSSTTDAVCST